MYIVNTIKMVNAERDGEFWVLFGHDVSASDGNRNVGHLQTPVRIAGEVINYL